MTSGCIGQVYFCIFSCSLAAPEVAVPTEGGCSRWECCAITVWVTDSTSALAIMAEMCFRISSGCRAGASPASGETRQPQRLPYKQYAIATALRHERRSVSEKAPLQDQFSERKCAGWSGVE